MSGGPRGDQHFSEGPRNLARTYALIVSKKSEGPVGGTKRKVGGHGTPGPPPWRRHWSREVCESRRDFLEILAKLCQQ